MINARIIDEDDGLREFTDVKAVRIHDKKYNLLIMQDYTSTIGELDGEAVFLLEDKELCFGDIKAFYKFSKNEFVLLITRGKD